MTGAMKVYVVMLDDRHLDPEPAVFTAADAAIAYAKQLAQEYGRPEDYEEQEIAGALFYARYSIEDDNVWVVEKELRS